MRDDFLRAAGVKAAPSAVAGVFYAAILALVVCAGWAIWAILTKGVM